MSQEDTPKLPEGPPWEEVGGECFAPYTTPTRPEPLLTHGSRMKLRGSAGPAVKNRNFGDEIRPFQVEFLIFQNLENNDFPMLEY